MLLAAVLRLWSLGERSLWLDEILTLRQVDGDAGHLLDRMAKEDSAPLYPVLAWAWGQVFGLSEAALRSLPALLGIATVPVVWAAAARVGGRRAAAFAALLAAASPFLVWHAQDARPYALLILLTAVAFLGFVHVLQGGGGRWFAVWAVASALALATHYDAVFPFAVEAAWLLVRARPRRRVLAACAVPVAVGLALVPLALAQSDGGVSGGGLGGNSGEGGADVADPVRFLGIDDVGNLGRRIAHLGGQFVAGYQPPMQVAAVALGVLLLALALLAILRTVPRERLWRLAAPAGVGAAVIAVPILLTPTGFNQVYTRFQSPAYVPLLIALAVALAWAGRRAAIPLLAALTVFDVAITVASAGDPKFGHQDWRGVLDGAAPPGGARAVVLSAHLQRDAVPVLRPEWEFWPDEAPVREIVLAALPLSYRTVGEAPVPPRPPAPTPPRGFRLVERRLAETFTVVRYRAARPVVLARDDLERLALDPAAHTVAWRTAP